MSATTSGATRRGVRPPQARLLAAGAVLAVGAAATMLLSDALDLGLESVVLLGAALGAVLALVPDATPARRLGGAAAGFAVAFVGYVVRAGFLPDSAAGRAVVVAVVVLACTLVAVATASRLPLWSVLLGSAGFTGAYELTFAAAPARVLETSVSTASSLALAAALGFALALLAGPSAGVRTAAPTRAAERGETAPADEPTTPLDQILETRA